MESYHSERAIVASVLQDPDLLIDLDVDGRTSLDMFQSPVNRTLMSTAIDLYNQGYKRFDRELIYSKAVMQDTVGTDAHQLRLYIDALFNADISKINFDKYIEELIGIYLKEETRRTLQQGLEELSKPKVAPVQFLGQLQTSLYNLDAKTKRKSGPVDITENIGDAIYKRLESPEENFGVPTGLQLLDDVMLGYIPKKFYFLSARPGVGKSAFLLQSAAHAAFFARINRTRVLYLDTEIPSEEFQERLIGHLAGVDTLAIRKGEWISSETAAHNVDYAIRLVNNSGGIYHEYIPGFTQGSVISTIKKFVYNHGIGLVILDYLKMPSGEDSAERWQRIGNLARALKEHAGILDVPIVTALQQNRKGESQSRVSSEANAESDDPFKEADGSFALNRKPAKEIQEEGFEAGTHRFQILKGRYFRTDWTGFNLRFIDYCLRFEPAPIQPFSTQEEQGNEYVSESTETPIPEISNDGAAPLR